MKHELKVEVSKYMSYLLRHNAENLKIDKRGFVDLEALLEKIRERFRVDRKFIFELVEKSNRRRFEIVGDKIRALYGHTIPVELEMEEDKAVRVLYHGTTPTAASQILRNGLTSMKRRWVHLSPTTEIAVQVGRRRTGKPVVLKIDAEAARKTGTKFYKATDSVYLCHSIKPEHIKCSLHK